MVVCVLGAFGLPNFADIGSRAEDIGPTGNNDGANRLLVADVTEYRFQLVAHLCIQRVLFLRSMELNDPYRTFLTVLDRLVHIRPQSDRLKSKFSGSRGNDDIAE